MDKALANDDHREFSTFLSDYIENYKNKHGKWALKTRWEALIYILALNESIAIYDGGGDEFIGYASKVPYLLDIRRILGS